MSAERTSRRRILIRVSTAIAIVLVAAVVLLAQWSPVANALFQAVATSLVKGYPELSVQFNRAGLRGPANTFAVSDFCCNVTNFAEARLDQLTIKYRLRPLLHGKGSLREITLSNLVLRVDATKPLPAVLRGKPGKEEKSPSRLDLKRPPDVDIRNAVISVTCAVTTSPSPATVVLTNMTLALGRGCVPEGALPYPFELRGAVCVDGGSPAAIACSGAARPDTLGADTADIDVSFSLNKFKLSDLNGALSVASPFVVETGEMDCSFSARCREGRLAGLVTITTSNLVIRPNKKGSSTFMQLSLDTWMILVRDQKGIIRVDCPIGGTLLQPVIPVDSVLAGQIGTAGRKIGAGVLDTVSVGLLHGVGNSWETSVDDRNRYDDILKVERIDPRERHFERARHYEKIVNDCATAVKEYTAQVTAFPAETNLAVRSLLATADIRNQRLADPKGAIAALKAIVETYHVHPDADDAMLKMIDILIEQKQYPDAYSLSREFGGKFPRSGLATQVEERRARIAKFVW